MAISKIKSDSIDTIAATKLTGTVDNARITLDAAEIPNLDAAKITTGDIANARIPSSAVTQHVTATDMTPLENDLAVLALQNAVNSNITAHGLQNSWIEQFEDSNSIALTNCDRVASGEYVASVSSVTEPFTSDANTNGLFHMDDTGLTDSSSNSHTTTLVGNTTRSGTQSKFGSYSAYFDGSADALKLPISSIQFGTGTWTVEGWFYPTNMSADTKYWTASSSHTSGWNNPSSTGAWTLGFKANGAPEILSQNGNSNVGSGTAAVLNTWTHVAVTHASGSSSVKVWKNGSLIDTIGVGGNYSYGMSGGQPAIGVYDFYSSNYRSPYTGYIDEFRISNIERYTTTFTPNTTGSSNATGSFTSTTITPQDSASKSSLGLVLLYKNNAGTNTLNTDIIAKVSADNGSNYSTCVLASKGTFSTGINIAIAPAIAVTAGTQLKYKVEFANQASGSKEAQIHGVALQY